MKFLLFLLLQEAAQTGDRVQGLGVSKTNPQSLIANPFKQEEL